MSQAQTVRFDEPFQVPEPRASCSMSIETFFKADEDIAWEVEYPGYRFTVMYDQLGRRDDEDIAWEVDEYPGYRFTVMYDQLGRPDDEDIPPEVEYPGHHLSVVYDKLGGRSVRLLEGFLESARTTCATGLQEPVPQGIEVDEADLVLPLIPRSRRIVKARITLRTGRPSLVIPDSLFGPEE